jgi:hypothetical protein
MLETITLSQEQLQHYVHVGAQRNVLVSPEEARICHQIGLFFATNLHLADYAIDVQQLVLTPRDDDEPPLASLTLVRRGREYQLESDEAGRVRLPWKSLWRRWRKRR